MTSEVSLAELYERHYRRVHALCRRMLGSAADADDAAQEVFVRAHRAFGRYDATQPFWRWISSIAVNHCIDIVRRRSKERELFGSGSVEELPADGRRHGRVRNADEHDNGEPNRTQASSVIVQLISAEQAERVKAAVDALPEKYRIPLVLAYYSDSSYDEIAAVLGTTRTHVGTLIFRAKQTLRRALRN